MTMSRFDSLFTGQGVHVVLQKFFVVVRLDYERLRLA
jgi:hypothetical protein